MSTDHVVRHEQELLSRHPRIVLLNHRSQFRNSTRMRIAGQDQVQNCHEMALPATEAAMQISCFAGVSLQ